MCETDSLWSYIEHTQYSMADGLTARAVAVRRSDSALAPRARGCASHPQLHWDGTGVRGLPFGAARSRAFYVMISEESSERPEKGCRRVQGKVERFSLADGEDAVIHELRAPLGAV